MSAVNLSKLYDENVSTLYSSEYVEAFDFEVFDIKSTYIFIVTQFTPLVTWLCLLYLGAVFVGPKIMRKRPAFNLRGPLVIWNVVLALFSIVTLLRSWPEFWFLMKQKDGLYKTACLHEVHSFPMAFWGHLFLFSKVIELGDTAFVILRKQQLNFLHWYHHAITLYLGFQMYETYDPVLRLPLILNSFVHTVMYSYFALKALKFRIPIQVSKCITLMQLTQMFIGLAVNLYTLALLEMGIPCERSRYNIYRMIIGAIVFVFLFSHFYVQKYWRTKVKSN